MATHTLQNYLRMYRKRSGLTQEDVAYLLGSRDGGKICRYERLTREPTLEAALGYEAIFNVPVRELFAGVFAEVEKRVIRRIGHLGRKLQTQRQTRMSARKLESLAVALKASRGRHE